MLGVWFDQLKRKGECHMTKEEKTICTHLPTIGYWSELGGVEVKQIEHTVDGIFVYCESGAWTGNHKQHKLKVRQERNAREYVQMRSYKLYLDECLRA